MNAKELTARGFRPVTLDNAQMVCAPCGGYRWFIWYDSPDLKSHACACETCGTVARSDERMVRTYPVTTEVAA
jgi:hypothetical protein